jgi:hypothetical protein
MLEAERAATKSAADCHRELAEPKETLVLMRSTRGAKRLAVAG